MVQISIDTKKDSHEEIREIIKYLQGIIGDSVVSESVPDSSEEVSAPAFSMFDTPEKKEDMSFNANEIFGSDDDAPSDVEKREDDDDPVIEIVEF